MKHPDSANSQDAGGSLQRHMRGLDTVLAVSKKLAATLDTQQILQATVDGVTKLVGLHTAAVYLLDGDMLRLRATTPPLPPDFPDEARNAALSGHPHIKKAISTRQPVFVPDFLAVEMTAAERAVAEQRHLRTLLFLPLVTDDKVIGAFIVGSIEQVVELSDIELDLSQALANLAALSLKNAELYEEGQKHAAELKAALDERVRAEEERKSLQAQLLQAQKLESLGRLAGGIAHDFNNLLMPIMGYIELGLKQLSPSDDLYGDLQLVKEAADRAASLTQQILAFSRKQVLEMRVVDLNEILDGFKKMIQRLIGENINLSIKPQQSPCLIRADAGQIDQMLLNLALNARDAMPDGGSLTVETASVDLDKRAIEKLPNISEPGKYVQLTVSDTGHGMDAETQKSIFDPFFTTKPAGEGTGLGLATVFGIVRQHGGDIAVASEPGKGTAFKIYLPHQTGAVQKAGEKVAQGLSTCGTETILVVEDEGVVLTLISRALAAAGYNILEANNPIDAIALAGNSKDEIDLLLTDMTMPDMDGRQLAREIQALYPKVATVFMSGYTTNINSHENLKEERAAFLQKPFTVENLMLKIRQMLD